MLNFRTFESEPIAGFLHGETWDMGVSLGGRTPSPPRLSGCTDCRQLLTQHRDALLKMFFLIIVFEKKFKLLTQHRDALLKNNYLFDHRLGNPHIFKLLPLCTVLL